MITDTLREVGVGCREENPVAGNKVIIETQEKVFKDIAAQGVKFPINQVRKEEVADIIRTVEG